MHELQERTQKGSDLPEKGKRKPSFLPKWFPWREEDDKEVSEPKGVAGVMYNVRRGLDAQKTAQQLVEEGERQTELDRKRGLEERRQEAFRWLSTTCVGVLEDLATSLEQNGIEVGELVLGKERLGVHLDEKATQVYLSWEKKEGLTLVKYKLIFRCNESGDGDVFTSGFNFTELRLYKKFAYPQSNWGVSIAYAQINPEDRTKEKAEKALQQIIARAPQAFGLENQDNLLP